MNVISLREAQSHRKIFLFHLFRILVASLCFHNFAKRKEKKFPCKQSTSKNICCYCCLNDIPKL